MDQCTGNGGGHIKHESCHRLANTGHGEFSMPTRTSDVGPPDGSRQPFLVVNANDRPLSDAIKVRPWITLSHCWGGLVAINHNAKDARREETKHTSRMHAEDLSRCRNHHSEAWDTRPMD